MGLINFFKHKHDEMPDLPQAEQTEGTIEPDVSTDTAQRAMTSLNAYAEAACPSATGLYPHEILMLSYAPAFHPVNNVFQKFWADQYGVCFPQMILDQLLENGYIEIAGLEETIAHLTTAKLKALLNRFGLNTAGKKADMIRSLMEAEDHREELEAEFPERYFVYTEKGTRELEENAYIMYLHSHRNSISLSIWDASKLIHQGEKPRTFPEILLQVLQEDAERHYENGEYGLYRNACLAAYTALRDAEMPQEAFHCLCETACYDLNGVGNGESGFAVERTEGQKELLSAKLKTLKKHFMPVVPAVKQWLLQNREELGVPDEAFKAMLLEEFKESSIPFQLFTDEECADIMIAVMNNDPTIPTALLATAEARLEEKLAAL